MTTTTTTTYGARFDFMTQCDGILDFLGEGTYEETDKNILAGALCHRLRDEVDARLPEGAFWMPFTSEFLHPVGAELPDADAMGELFDEAWQAVAANFVEIETATLGTKAA